MGAKEDKCYKMLELIGPKRRSRRRFLVPMGARLYRDKLEHDSNIKIGPVTDFLLAQTPIV